MEIDWTHALCVVLCAQRLAGWLIEFDGHETDTTRDASDDGTTVTDDGRVGNAFGLGTCPLRVEPSAAAAAMFAVRRAEPSTLPAVLCLHEQCYVADDHDDDDDDDGVVSDG